MVELPVGNLLWVVAVGLTLLAVMHAMESKSKHSGRRVAGSRKPKLRLKRKTMIGRILRMFGNFSVALLGDDEDEGWELQRGSVDFLTRADEEDLELVGKGFRKVEFFFARSEIVFYKVLQEVVAGRCEIMAKVKLWDLVNRTGGAKLSLENRVSQKHVDFVLLSLGDYRPLVVIELDGSTHDKKKQRKGDAFKDAALGSAGLPLLRFEVRREYSKQGIHQALVAAGVFGGTS